MSSNFEFSIITPGKEHIQYKAIRVTTETIDGSVQFLANHIPVVLATVPCITYIKTEEGNEFKLFTSSGLIYFSENTMKFICDAAEYKEDIDIQRAILSEERAKSRLDSKKTDIDMERAKVSLDRARVRIKFVNEG